MRLPLCDNRLGDNRAILITAAICKHSTRLSRFRVLASSSFRPDLYNHLAFWAAKPLPSNAIRFAAMSMQISLFVMRQHDSFGQTSFFGVRLRPLTPSAIICMSGFSGAECIAALSPNPIVLARFERRFA